MKLTKTTDSNSSAGGGLNLNKSGDTPGSKFNLSKSDSGGATGGTAGGGTSNDSGGVNSGSGKGRWIWGLLIVAAIGVGAFLMTGGSGGTGDVPSSDSNGQTVGVGRSGPTAPAVPDTQTPGTGENNAGGGVSDPGNTVGQTGSTDQADNTGGTPNPPVNNPPLEGTIEEKARMVIDGAYGNGASRRRALSDQYDVIQAKVNELLRTN